MASQFFSIGENLTSSIVNQSKKVGNTIKTSAISAGTKLKENPTVTKACVIGLMTGVTAPLTILPALSVVGFTSTGVAAASFAASIQTATTVSGSVFALCQSAAATGVVATSTSLGVGVVAGTTTSGITAAICRIMRRSQNNVKTEQAEIDEMKQDGPNEEQQSQDNSNTLSGSFNEENEPDVLSEISDAAVARKMKASKRFFFLALLLLLVVLVYFIVIY